MKLDILVMAVHPDDAELACAGTIVSEIAKGKKVGILEFTKGELGTRGTPEIRIQESKESSMILGLSIRENLGFKDGFFVNDEYHQKAIIEVLRKYQPEIVLCNAIEDRHPDHGRSGMLAIDACFYSGLRKIEIKDKDGTNLEPWRPKNVYQYIQDKYIEPDFVVDISGFWDIKLQSIKAFKSQFFDPNNSEPASYISSAEFLDFVEARSKVMGHKIGVKYGEGYTKTKMIGINSLFDIF